MPKRRYQQDCLGSVSGGGPVSALKRRKMGLLHGVVVRLATTSLLLDELARSVLCTSCRYLRRWEIAIVFFSFDRPAGARPRQLSIVTSCCAVGSIFILSSTYSLKQHSRRTDRQASICLVLWRCARSQWLRKGRPSWTNCPSTPSVLIEGRCFLTSAGKVSLSPSDGDCAVLTIFQRVSKRFPPRGH